MEDETTYQIKEKLVTGYNLREPLKQKMIEDLQKAELTNRIKELKEFLAENIIDVKLFENHGCMQNYIYF
ncbi:MULTISPECIES: hypothetical protein [Pseudothermotoga]|jgi:ribosomal protein S15P/S13E|uniref:Uncharacterized protein n=1 Tax=Pseudothermotoga lettingae (strain ATCC BAA-301 / DSM 14385 / NBRC 107922 / TMO) TaxID=416591 RepID=A8F3D2_PSELT|nr:MULTISPECIES: hypothetical protein [Pseudothermotoga]ABV32666.1 hypothetical protein Tlet_0095 [Pseudothermotoga lettingae TMO]MDK2885072.1 hypothetical protein [Pseudothermotoga sp.]MDN5338555.1 hypothetical protein [Thermotogaceae bacterium]GLI48341.1 hypothetical protein PLETTINGATMO_05100 [Pseudothermotoga lettingae TMO]